MTDMNTSLNVNDRQAPIQWLWINTYILVGVAIFYVIVHNFPLIKVKYGWENVKLDKERIQTLNAIFLTPVSGETATTAAQSTTLSGSLLSPDNSFLPPTPATLVVARQYIKNELGRVDTTQLTDVTNLLRRLPAQACISYLLTQKFKVESFFWLVGGQAYWEVIFWSIFGVLASCLFIVSSSLRSHNETKDEVFDISDIPYQAVKLLYAPLCVLILVFAYNLISGDTLTDIEAGKGTLIFAFITGFYSGRMMTLLNRLKEVILPGDDPTPKLTAQKVDGTDGSVAADDLIVNVVLDPAQVDPAIFADINTGGLDKTLIDLKDRAGTTLTTLVKINDDQDAQFVAHHVLPGSYKLVGTLSTEDGSNFSTEKELIISATPSSRKVNLMLHFSETVE